MLLTFILVVMRVCKSVSHKFYYVKYEIDLAGVVAKS